jgi:N-acetylmuramoyl-L-alanine amidase
MGLIMSVKTKQLRRDFDVGGTGNWERKFFYLAVGLLFGLPLAASANDSELLQGSCGFFQFTSSTAAEVNARLVAGLKEQVEAKYLIAAEKYKAEVAQSGDGCVGYISPLPTITYCSSPLDCLAQINAQVSRTCSWGSTQPAVGTYAIVRGGCTYGAALPPPPPPKKKVIVLDPGHGLNCAAVGQAVGAVGVTDFPPIDPPPGKLLEDNLTFSIATEAKMLLSTKYDVKLTKASINACPTFKERGAIANNANAKIFVSIHINASNQLLGVQLPIGNGTSVIYNPATSTPEVATRLSSDVSVSLGTNNRGAMKDERGLAVLKPTVTKTPAVLLEVGRLSGADETKLHAAGSTKKVAAGIQSTVQAFISN